MDVVVLLLELLVGEDGVVVLVFAVGVRGGGVGRGGLPAENGK